MRSQKHRKEFGYDSLNVNRAHNTLVIVAAEVPMSLVRPRLLFDAQTILIAVAFLAAGGCAHRPSVGGPGSRSQYVARTIAVPNSGLLYVESKGQGRPVVLIHGGQLDRRMWDREFDALANQFHVIRYDVRGFGLSPASGDTSFRS